MEMKKDPDHSKGRKPFFEKELVIVNIGVKQFYEDLKKKNIRVSHVDWQPPAGGDCGMAAILDKLL